MEVYTVVALHNILQILVDGAKIFSQQHPVFNRADLSGSGPLTGKRSSQCHSITDRYAVVVQRSLPY